MYPWASIKYLNNMIMPNTLAMLTSSDSMELPTFILYLLAKLKIVPFPMDIIAPVCAFESQCTPNYPSTHQTILERLSAVK